MTQLLCTLSMLALMALAVTACGDDSKTETPPAKTGTLKVRVDTTTDGVTGICYDVAIRDGANAIVTTRQRTCVESPQALEFEEECSAEPGRVTHTVSVTIAALWIEDETPYDPSVAGAADLALVVNPCANGCSVQVSCVEKATREANLNLTILPPATQGFLDIAINGSLPDTDGSERTPGAPVQLSTDPMICYGLEVTDGLGEAVEAPQVLCASKLGDGAGGVSVVALCNARSGRTATRVAVSLVGVFREIPDNFDDQNPGPGVKAEYGFTCTNNCIQTIECVADEDVAVTFEPVIRRVYIPGTFDISVNNTLTGEGSETVAGGCYSTDVANAKGDVLIGQPGLCSAFNPGGSGAAGVAFSGPCDSTPYTDDADGRTTDHVVTLKLLSLYAAEGAPAASGTEPSETLEGYANPCSDEAPCVVNATCIEAEPTTVTIAAETVFSMPEPL